MANDPDMFMPGSLITPKTTTMVRVGNGSLLPIQGKGCVNIQTINSKRENKTIILEHVLFVPTLQVNLFSVAQFVKTASNSFIMDAKNPHLKYNGNTIPLMANNELLTFHPPEEKAFTVSKDEEKHLKFGI